MLHAVPGDQTKHTLSKDCVCKPRLTIYNGNFTAMHKDPEYSWVKKVAQAQGLEV